MTGNRKTVRALISGGGTGGHIFPALSIAAEIEKQYPGSEILFVGAEDRMEMQRVPAAGYNIIGLPVAGFDRKHLWRNFGVLLKLWHSIRKARKIVADFKPDIAIGVGGYASGPTLKAAQRAGVPTVLQEQNSYAGVTNKLLAAKAKAICVAYPGMERFFPEDKIVMTGNPVRSALLQPGMTQEEAKRELGVDPGMPMALILGGSLGALTINNAVTDALQKHKAEGAPFSVLWQTGSRYFDRCSKACEDFATPNVKVTDFISDMAVAYCAADLVVARAGAGTISELELLGKPAILVPSPNVAENHQMRNAEALANVGAAGLVSDNDAVEHLWDEMAATIENSCTLATLSTNIKKLALPDSDKKIVETITKVLSHE